MLPPLSKTGKKIIKLKEAIAVNKYYLIIFILFSFLSSALAQEKIASAVLVPQDNEPFLAKTVLEKIPFNPLNPAAKKTKIIFRKAELRLALNNYDSYSRAFILPPFKNPYQINLISDSFFESPLNSHLNIKSIFCPSIILLNKDYQLIYKSDFKDLKTKYHIFIDPTFELQFTINEHFKEARYLLLVRLKQFDGNFIESNHAVPNEETEESEDHDSYEDEEDIKPIEKEKIHSSLIGRLKIFLKKEKN